MNIHWHRTHLVPVVTTKMCGFKQWLCRWLWVTITTPNRLFKFRSSFIFGMGEARVFKFSTYQLCCFIRFQATFNKSTGETKTYLLKTLLCPSSLGNYIINPLIVINCLNIMWQPCLILEKRFIFRPHRSNTYIDVAYCYRLWSVNLLVGLSVTLMSPAKTAEPIEMPFGLRPK